MWYCLFNNQSIYMDKYRDSYFNSIVSLEKDLFEDPYDRIDLLLPEPVREHIFILCLFSSCSSIGYANVLLTAPSANLDRIGINKAFQRLGFGRLLLGFLVSFLYHEHKISAVNLEVNSKNQPALDFYGHFGFFRNGLRKDYYDKGQDAVLMEYDCFEHLDFVDVEYRKWKKEML